MDDEGNQIPLQTDFAHPFEILHWSYLQCLSTMSPVNEDFICRSDRALILNISQPQIDGWMVFSPKSNKHTHMALPLSSLLASDLWPESLLSYFLDNEQTSNHRSIIFALWQLTESSSNSLLTNEDVIFTADYKLRHVSISIRRQNDRNPIAWKWDRQRIISKLNAYPHIGLPSPVDSTFSHHPVIGQRPLTTQIRRRVKQRLRCCFCLFE